MMLPTFVTATLFAIALASPVHKKRDDCSETGGTIVDAVTGSLSPSELPTYPGGYHPPPWGPSTGYSGSSAPRTGTAGTSSTEGSPVTASNSTQPWGTSPTSQPPFTATNSSFSGNGPTVTIETITVTLPTFSGPGYSSGTGGSILTTYSNSTSDFVTGTGSIPAAHTTNITSVVTVPLTTTISLSSVISNSRVGSSWGSMSSGNSTAPPGSTETSPITASYNSSTPCATGHTYSTKTLVSSLVSTLNTTISFHTSPSGTGVPTSSTAGSPENTSNSTSSVPATSVPGSSSSAPRQGSQTTGVVTVTVTKTPSKHHHHHRPTVPASNGTLSIPGTSPYSSGPLGTTPAPYSTQSYTFSPIVSSSTWGSSSSSSVQSEVGSTPGSPVTGSSSSQSGGSQTSSSALGSSSTTSTLTQTLTQTLTTSSSATWGGESSSAESRTGSQTTYIPSLSSYSPYIPTGTGPPIFSSPSSTEGSPVTGSESSTVSTSTTPSSAPIPVSTANRFPGKYGPPKAYIQQPHHGSWFRHWFRKHKDEAKL